MLGLELAQHRELVGAAHVALAHDEHAVGATALRVVAHVAGKRVREGEGEGRRVKG